MNRQEVIQQQIDEIMDWFDFAKVQKVMDHLEWTWNGDYGPPSEAEIRQHARQAMKDVARGGCQSIGGFEARVVEGSEDGKPWLSLSLAFAVSEWCVDGVTYEPEDGEQ
jgi:hypothetical protein